MGRNKILLLQDVSRMENRGDDLLMWGYDSISTRSSPLLFPLCCPARKALFLYFLMLYSFFLIFPLRCLFYPRFFFILLLILFFPLFSCLSIFMIFRISLSIFHCFSCYVRFPIIFLDNTIFFLIIFPCAASFLLVFLLLNVLFSYIFSYHAYFPDFFSPFTLFLSFFLLAVLFSLFGSTIFLFSCLFSYCVLRFLFLSLYFCLVSEIFPFNFCRAIRFS